MANPFRKGLNYLKSSVDKKIEDNADPKVQVQQAINEAKRVHQQITEQAAEVIGQKSRLEMEIHRVSKQVEQYQAQTEQALKSSAQALEAGKSQESRQYDQAAEVIAAQLVAAENQLEELKVQHSAAQAAAADAKAQQQLSQVRLKEQLEQADQLLAQADQAKMQEQSAQSLGAMDALSPDSAAPTLDGIRAKVEKRYAQALGRQELSQASGADVMAEVSAASRDMRAEAKLEEIRASLDNKTADRKPVDKPKSLEEKREIEG